MTDVAAEPKKEHHFARLARLRRERKAAGIVEEHPATKAARLRREAQAIRAAHRATEPAPAPPVVRHSGSTDPLAGLSRTECCIGCHDGHCVITGINVCGHPQKGGLQPTLMMQPDVLSRYTAAKKRLAIDDIQNRT